MTWSDFIEKHGDVFESRYERVFVEAVLANVPGLSPSSVRCQTEFHDSRGISRRVDFTVEEGPLVQLALEVDGWDKKGRGHGMTRTEFTAWSRRELDLTSQGWTVLRFANSLVTRWPEECARHIQLTLQKLRGVSAAAELPHASSTSGLSPADSEELAELERRRKRALEELGSQLAKAESENRGMKTIAVSFAVVVLAMLAIILVLNQEGRDVESSRSGARAPEGVGSRLPEFCPDGINWLEAAEHLGEYVDVRGPVVSGRYNPDLSGQPTFLNVGRDFPDPRRLTVVVWGRDRSGFNDPPESAFLGREICVSGRVESYQGQIQVELDGLSLMSTRASN